jgi:hypothetical protein
VSCPTNTKTAAVTAAFNQEENYLNDSTTNEIVPFNFYGDQIDRMPRLRRGDA